MLPKHTELLDLIQYGVSHSTHSVHEMEFMLVRAEHCTIICFRGTELKGNSKDSFWERLQNKLDIVRDVRVLPWKSKRLPAGQAGFVRGAIAVIDAIKHQLVSEYTNSTPIVLCGHSLGGALSVATGFLMNSEGYNVVEIVTFGSPKVFYRGERAYRGKNFRITMYKYGKDIITHVFLGRHPVKQTKVGKSSSWFWNFKDHSLDKYQEAKHNNELL